MCLRHHVDIIYHASFTDEEGMDLLEEARRRVRSSGPGFCSPRMARS